MKFTHTFSALAFAGMLLTGIPAAEAVSLTTSGTWADASIANNGTNVQGFDTNQLSWGTPPAGGSQSSYIFDGSNQEIDGNALFSGESFKLGTFTHNNNPIFGDSLLTDATIDLSLDIDGNVANFTYVFNHTETPNDGSGICPGGLLPCADIVASPNATSSEVVTIDGTDFNLEILGFMDSPDAPLESQFITAESQTNTTMLFARLTEAPPVPEPTTLLGSVLLLGLGAGFKKRQSV